MTGDPEFVRRRLDIAPADPERGLKMLQDLILERIFEQYAAEQEMLARAQLGDKSIEPDQVSDAPCVAPIDVSFVCDDDGHA